MKLTVIPADSIIIKDGRPLVFAFAAEASLHALQWHGEHGVVELIGAGAEHFTDAEIIAPFVAAFDAEAARLDAEAAARPVPTAAQVRAREISARLAAVDAASIRALRAKVIGKGKAADDTKLAALDSEADTLRAELAALVV